MSVSEQLESQIRLFQGSIYQVSKQSGVANASLLRFLSGKRGLSMEAIDKLADFFGLELTPKAAGRPPATPPRAWARVERKSNHAERPGCRWSG